ncbi:MAG TPA: AI-2E family transporter, partial [Bacteroidales bacterium]|nr:AI-2E family transporter [Bacteroidales bacterium]
ILLQPFIYSSSVKAHPLEIFIVLLMGGSIAGVIGMVLAIPAYTVIRVIASQFLNRFRIVQKLTERMRGT